jgi:hypothetical protein
MSEPGMRKITVRLFESDLEVLRQYYPVIGYNKILRLLVRKHVRDLLSKTQELLTEENGNDREPKPKPTRQRRGQRAKHK